METARERLYRLLLTHPKQPWLQKDLAARARCSKGHVSRVVDSLISAGVLAQPYKNRIVLTGPSKLLTLWASRRSLPAPTYVVTTCTPEEIETALRKRRGLGLTLFRAAWHRTKFMATSAVEVYVPTQELSSLAARLGAASADPTSIALYPTDGAELEGLERVDSLPLVSVPQNFVDLMAVGGQGPRAAFHLARTAGLLEG